MIARRTLLWPYALAAFVASACGPDGCVKPVKQCPPGVKCISYDEYCDQAPESLWTMGQVCGVIAKDVPYPAGFPQRDRRCTDELARLIDAGMVQFNAVAAELCVESRKTSCDPSCRWNYTSGLNWSPEQEPVARCSPPCDRIFTGLKETGESCSLSAECLDGLWCDTTKGCPGRCARQVSNGERTPRLEACRTPLVVRLSDGGLICDDLRDAGATCARADDERGDHHCRPGLACGPQPLEVPDAGDGGSDAGEPDGGADGGEPDAGPRPWVCISWPDAGAVPGFGCEQTGCPFGQYCAVSNFPAFACVTLADRHQACDLGGISKRPCLTGYSCQLDGGIPGACEPSSAGARCGEGCGPGFFCDFDAGCTSVAQVGGSCAGSDECAAGLNCITSNDAGTCFTPSLAGQACGDPAGHQCAYGFECHDGGCIEAACLPSP